MRLFQRCFAAAVGLVAVSVPPAMAADLGDSMKDAPAPVAHIADDWHGWMIRARVLGVFPDAGASDFSVAGADLDIDNSVVPELDFTYFFNRNIAIEAIAAVTPHDIHGEGAIAGADIGDAWLLPPTVLLQYHFHMDHGIKPYVGVGVNYTVFFNEDPGPTFTSLDLDNSFGFALQAGVDIHLRDRWYLNIDVKKIWLKTDASVSGGTITADVDIDPLIVGVGLGYKF